MTGEEFFQELAGFQRLAAEPRPVAEVAVPKSKERLAEDEKAINLARAIATEFAKASFSPFNKNGEPNEEQAFGDNKKIEENKTKYLETFTRLAKQLGYSTTDAATLKQVADEFDRVEQSLLKTATVRELLQDVAEDIQEYDAEARNGFKVESKLRAIINANKLDNTGQGALDFDATIAPIRNALAGEAWAQFIADGPLTPEQQAVLEIYQMTVNHVSVRAFQQIDDPHEYVSQQRELLALHKTRQDATRDFPFGFNDELVLGRANETAEACVDWTLNHALNPPFKYKDIDKTINQIKLSLSDLLGVTIDNDGNITDVELSPGDRAALYTLLEPQVREKLVESLRKNLVQALLKIKNTLPSVNEIIENMLGENGGLWQQMLGRIRFSFLGLKPQQIQLRRIETDKLFNDPPIEPNRMPWDWGIATDDSGEEGVPKDFPTQETLTKVYPFPDKTYRDKADLENKTIIPDVTQWNDILSEDDAADEDGK